MNQLRMGDGGRRHTLAQRPKPGDEARAPHRVGGEEEASAAAGNSCGSCGGSTNGAAVRKNPQAYPTASGCGARDQRQALDSMAPRPSAERSASCFFGGRLGDANGYIIMVVSTE